MNSEITISIQTIIMIISAVISPLIGVIIYFYHVIERNHTNDIRDYQKQIEQRDTHIIELKNRIATMEATIDRLYTAFNRRRNGG